MTARDDDAIAHTTLSTLRSQFDLSLISADFVTCRQILLEASDLHLLPSGLEAFCNEHLHRVQHIESILKLNKSTLNGIDPDMFQEKYGQPIYSDVSTAMLVGAALDPRVALSSTSSQLLFDMACEFADRTFIQRSLLLCAFEIAMPYYRDEDAIYDVWDGLLFSFPSDALTVILARCLVSHKIPATLASLGALSDPVGDRHPKLQLQAQIWLASNNAK